MNDQIVGFILKQLDYRDNDYILTVFTNEYGKMSFIVAGAKKMASKNRGSTLPLTKVEIQYDHKQNQSMFRLKTAKSMHLYRNIHEDLEKSNAANVIAEIADALSLAMNEDDNAQEIYQKIDLAFQALEDNHDIKTVLSLYLVDMMQIYGILPDVDECVSCGNTVVSAISTHEGGFLCKNCANRFNMKESTNEDLKRFRLLVKGGLEHLDIIESATKATFDDLTILKDITEKYTGFQFKSLALFYRLFGIE